MSSQSVISAKDPNFFNPKLSLVDEDKQKAVEDVLNPLALSAETVQKIRAVFENELELGSALKPTQPPLFHMDNTFVPELPDGTETGEYLGLDVGATNFRVILLRLKPGEQAEFVVKHYPVSPELRTGPGEKLFDFIAQCIHSFLEELHQEDKSYKLGFTFSFPVIQKSLDVGILENWAGTYNCSNVIGNDAAQMLADAINRRGDLKIDVVAILNDTTATLVTGAFLDPTCGIGAILGSGTNGAYIDKVERIEKLASGDYSPTDEVIINPEFGFLCDKNRTDFMITEFDRAIDEASTHPGHLIFEKIVGGHLFGELIRLILVKLVENKLLFEGIKSTKLMESRSIAASDVSAIEGDESDSATQALIRRLGYEHPSADDVTIVKHVCAVASVRLAKLLSLCIASLLDRMNKPMVAVAMDGSLYKYHPKFNRLITQFVSEMAPGKKFKLILAEDGSGKGAALVAAVASRVLKAKKHLHVFKKEHDID